MHKNYIDQLLIHGGITVTACEIFQIPYCMLSNYQCAANISLGMHYYPWLLAPTCIEFPA